MTYQYFVSYSYDNGFGRCTINSRLRPEDNIDNFLDNIERVIIESKGYDNVVILFYKRI